MRNGFLGDGRLLRSALLLVMSCTAGCAQTPGPSLPSATSLVQIHPASQAADKADSNARSTEPRLSSGSAAPATLTAVRSVWKMPEFLRARAACQKRQYQQAADILVHLREKPTLTDAERAFCKQQETLCQSLLHPAAPTTTALSLRGRGDQGAAIVHDSNEPSEKTLDQERLLQMSGGYLLTLRR